MLHDKCIFIGPLLWKKNGKRAGYGFFPSFQMWKFGIFDCLFQTCILKTVFKEMEIDVNTFFFPHDTPEQEAALEGPLFICCCLQVSSFLMRGSSRNESARRILSPHRAPGPALGTTVVTEQLAASEQLQGNVSWGWLQEGASWCHLSCAGWWHSKGCSSLPPGWPFPPSLSYLLLPSQKEWLTLCRNIGWRFQVTRVGFKGSAEDWFIGQRFKPQSPTAAWKDNTEQLCTRKSTSSPPVLCSGGLFAVGLLAPLAWEVTAQDFASEGDAGDTRLRGRTDSRAWPPLALLHLLKEKTGFGGPTMGTVPAHTSPTVQQEADNVLSVPLSAALFKLIGIMHNSFTEQFVAIACYWESLRVQCGEVVHDKGYRTPRSPPALSAPVPPGIFWPQARGGTAPASLRGYLTAPLLPAGRI